MKTPGGSPRSPFPMRGNSSGDAIRAGLDADAPLGAADLQNPLHFAGNCIIYFKQTVKPPAIDRFGNSIGFCARIEQSSRSPQLIRHCKRPCTSRPAHFTFHPLCSYFARRTACRLRNCRFCSACRDIRPQPCSSCPRHRPPVAGALTTPRPPARRMPFALTTRCVVRPWGFLRRLRRHSGTATNRGLPQSDSNVAATVAFAPVIS
jgi:hypothetical protein